MKSKFLEKALADITPLEHALMLRSLEIISQIHEILERKGITQKSLAEGLKISPAAVSKMLSPGGNLESTTIVKLELFLGETIITTPKRVREQEQRRTLSIKARGKKYLQVSYTEGECALYINSPLLVVGAN